MLVKDTIAIGPYPSTSGAMTTEICHLVNVSSICLLHDTKKFN